MTEISVLHPIPPSVPWPLSKVGKRESVVGGGARGEVRGCGEVISKVVEVRLSQRWEKGECCGEGRNVP